jgi:hypothetical protein
VWRLGRGDETPEDLRAEWREGRIRKLDEKRNEPPDYDLV